MLKIKRLVSKKKRRFQQDGFDLDLTYVTDRLIAMGFPSEGIEGVYRNHMDDVQRFFQKFHYRHFKIYNLCSERSYVPSMFHNSYASFPFDDHNPCAFETLLEFCENVQKFLDRHPQNVIVAHCKAGKGRTGTVLAAYMLYSNMLTEASEALEHFAAARTANKKGVTIPSQIRYIRYMERYLKSYQRLNRPFNFIGKPMRLVGFCLMNWGKECEPWFVISIQGGFEIYNQRKSSKTIATWSKDTPMLAMKCDVVVEGDFRVMFYTGDKELGKKKKVCGFWLHTSFIHCTKMVFDKKDLDVANKNKSCPETFRVEAYFAPLPGTNNTFSSYCTSPDPTHPGFDKNYSEEGYVEFERVGYVLEDTAAGSKDSKVVAAGAAHVTQSSSCAQSSSSTQSASPQRLLLTNKAPFRPHDRLPVSAPPPKTAAIKSKPPPVPKRLGTKPRAEAMSSKEEDGLSNTISSEYSNYSSVAAPDYSQIDNCKDVEHDQTIVDNTDYPATVRPKTEHEIQEFYEQLRRTSSPRKGADEAGAILLRPSSLGRSEASMAHRPAAAPGSAQSQDLFIVLDRPNPPPSSARKAEAIGHRKIIYENSENAFVQPRAASTPPGTGTSLSQYEPRKPLSKPETTKPNAWGDADSKGPTALPVDQGSSRSVLSVTSPQLGLRSAPPRPLSSSVTEDDTEDEDIPAPPPPPPEGFKESRHRADQSSSSDDSSSDDEDWEEANDAYEEDS